VTVVARLLPFLGAANKNRPLALPSIPLVMLCDRDIRTQAISPPRPGPSDDSAGTNSLLRAEVIKMDPALGLSTYISVRDGVGMQSDSGGLAYWTGFAFSGFPTTSGAFRTSFRQRPTPFVASWNATGSSLLYSTYLGGQSDEEPMASCEFERLCLVDGLYYSTDFPTTAGALQRASEGRAMRS